MSTLSPDRWQEISRCLDEVLSLPEQERAKVVRFTSKAEAGSRRAHPRAAERAQHPGKGAIPRTRSRDARQ